MRRSSPGPRAALPEGSLLGTRWRFLNERGGLPGAGNAPTAAEAAAAPGGRAHCRGADEAAGAELVALRARIGRRRRRVEERLAAAASSGDDGVRELLLGAGGGGPKTRWAPAPLVGGPHAQKARSEAETAAHRRGRTSPGRAQLHQQQAPPGAGGGSGGRARRRQLQPLSSPVASSRRARDGGTADAQARAAIVAARNSYGAWYIAPGKWASASAAARAAAGGVGEGGAEGSRVALLGSDAALQAMGVLGSEPLSPHNASGGRVRPELADLRIARRLRKYVAAGGGRVPHFLEGITMETGRRRLSNVPLDFEKAGEPGQTERGNAASSAGGV